MKRKLSIILLALLATLMISCGDDDETTDLISFTSPTAGQEVTTATLDVAFVKEEGVTITGLTASYVSDEETEPRVITPLNSDGLSVTITFEAKEIGKEMTLTVAGTDADGNAIETSVKFMVKETVATAEVKITNPAADNNVIYVEDAKFTVDFTLTEANKPSATIEYNDGTADKTIPITDLAEDASSFDIPDLKSLFGKQLSLTITAKDADDADVTKKATFTVWPGKDLGDITTVSVDSIENDTNNGMDMYNFIADPCKPSNPEGSENGPELLYPFSVKKSGKLTATITYESDVDPDIHLVKADLLTCLTRGDKEIADYEIKLDTTVTVGKYYIIVDTYTKGSGVELPGEFKLDVSFDAE